MANDAKSITLKACRFDEVAKIHLLTVTKDRCAILEAEKGFVALWAVLKGGERFGTLTTRIDKDLAGDREFVITNAYIKNFGVDCMKAIMPAIEELARQLKCKCVRFHTVRKGFERKALKAGFEKSEVVYRKAL